MRKSRLIITISNRWLPMPMKERRIVSWWVVKDNSKTRLTPIKDQLYRSTSQHLHPWAMIHSLTQHSAPISNFKAKQRTCRIRLEQLIMCSTTEHLNRCSQTKQINTLSCYKPPIWRSSKIAAKESSSPITVCLQLLWTQSTQIWFTTSLN